MQTDTLTGLASHLVYDGLLAIDHALKLQQHAAEQNTHFVSYLVKNNILCSNDILNSCAKSFGLPIIDLSHYEIKSLDKSILNIDIIRRYHLIPLKKHNDILQIGLSDPTNKHAIEAVTFHTGLTPAIFLIAEDQLDHCINTYFDTLKNKKLELGIVKDLDLEDHNSIINENSVSYEEPLIRFVNHLIQHALQQHASDIHIEPNSQHCQIRYRQDGVLYKIAELPLKLALRLVTRLKVIANLNISERRLPQDGRFQLFNTDIRINTCPTLFGEKIVLRLLDLKKLSLEINDLGFSEMQKKIFLNKISAPQGLILVTGPTGSGKTVTLYSALNQLNTLEKNISTIEDPIEIQINGINQVNINPKINFNFSTALRTFLRQDPDIIMVGEIRDFETAEIATQAAQTGHLVFSTLHTNSALDTITRLQAMGLQSYNIISSVSLIIAQRLIRKLCNHCKQPDTITTEIAKELGLNTANNMHLYRAIGCEHCLMGYLGRVGIYEFLPISKSIIKLIMENSTLDNLQKLAQKENFISLRNIGLEKVYQGVTSLAEINRVTQK